MYIYIGVKGSVNLGRGRYKIVKGKKRRNLENYYMRVREIWGYVLDEFMAAM